MAQHLNGRIRAKLLTANTLLLKMSLKRMHP